MALSALSKELKYMFPVQHHNTEYDQCLELWPIAISSGEMKPKGAFWTSTYDGSSSAWIDWCDYEAPYFIKPYNFLLTVDPNARIYVIDNLKDLESLIYEYPYHGSISRFLGDFVNWAAMANDYDGVQVTERGQWATRMTKPGLYGWDCESTAWFRWVFTNVERI